MSDAPLFNYEDLSKILGRVRMMPKDPSVIFTTWGIDDKDLLRFMHEGAQEGVEEYEGLSEVETAWANMLVGFAIGFQVAQEIAMREEARNGKDD